MRAHTKDPQEVCSAGLESADIPSSGEEGSLVRVNLEGALSTPRGPSG